MQLEVAERALRHEVRAGLGAAQDAILHHPLVLPAHGAPPGQAASPDEPDRLPPRGLRCAFQPRRADARPVEALPVGHRHRAREAVALHAPGHDHVARLLLPLRRDGEAQRVARELHPRDGARAADDPDELPDERLVPALPHLEPGGALAVGGVDRDVPAPEQVVRGRAMRRAAVGGRGEQGEREKRRRVSPHGGMLSMEGCGKSYPVVAGEGRAAPLTRAPRRAARRAAARRSSRPRRRSC